MKVDNKGELVKEAADTNIDISQISTSKTSGKFANPKLPDTIGKSVV